MFDGPGFPAALEESVFEEWLEEGRKAQMGYEFLLLIWDSYDHAYKALYTDERNDISRYEKYGSASGREALVAAYDLFSESKLL